MESTIQRTWKPTTAGVLNIISGALSAVGVIGIIISMFFMESIFDGILDGEQFIPPANAPFIAPLVSTILIIVLVLSAIEAVFPIVGGVFALQRRKWGWALAGSIIAIFGNLPLGVASTIFVAIAKNEFE